jgi:succinyl-CoA synthetase beta subunit
MALRRLLANPLAKISRSALAVQKRHLNIHEYQSSVLMAEMGVNVPEGYAASTVAEAVAAAAKIGDQEVVIKAQILAGGRGLGKFTNGLQGGVHIIKTSQVAEYASKMLGGTLVTKQVCAQPPDLALNTFWSCVSPSIGFN